MKVAAFTGSPTISSRRFRVLQYIEPLGKLGIEIDEFVSKHGSWPPRERWKRPIWLPAAVAERIGPTIASHRYDAVLLQREFISTLYTLERFTGRPRLLDVDDAVWLNGSRAERSFAALCRSCDGVICGNDYIADVVRQWNSKIIIVPTAVDTNRFRPPKREAAAKRQIIGWSGLHAGSHFLLGVEEPIFRLLQDRPDAVLRIVSDSRPNFRYITEDMYEFIRWSPENEVRTIQEMDVGLMPIDDSEWSKGKCSYKMLLYMSCGVPVIVSPFGMNNEVLSHGEVGFGCKSAEEWYDTLRFLLDHPEEGRRRGDNGRAVVQAHYSRDIIVNRLADFIFSFKAA